MRALLGILILGGLFLAAASWQRRHTQDLREQRRVEHGVPLDPRDTHTEAGWSLLVLGRPSGSPPLALPDDTEAPPPPPTAQPDEAGGGGTVSAAPRYGPDYEYKVRPADTLGGICKKHYGTANPQLVSAVARYNGLSSPDAIVVGRTLLLPDRALLDR